MRSSKAISPKTDRPSKTTNTRNSVKLLSSKTSFTGKVFHITSDRVLEPNGVTAVRDVVRHSGSAVVLAVDDNGSEPRVLLERQYRYPARDYLWEIPAGRIDPKENPLAAAKRELLEETGYRAKSWHKALFFFPSPGFMDETMTVFLAQDLRPGEAQPEQDERIDCELIPLSRAVDMVMSGEIRDGKTIVALLWFQQWRKG
jgi:ADP-ribose pyrophosphatase